MEVLRKGESRYIGFLVAYNITWFVLDLDTMDFLEKKGFFDDLHTSLYTDNGSFPLSKFGIKKDDILRRLKKRYNDFIRQPLVIDTEHISTTDVGQNIYVEHNGFNLTFQIIRNAYYINRIKENKFLPDDKGIIGELGSGGCELAILFKKMFPQYKYICFDLPEVLLTGSYNIKMSFPNLKIGLYVDFKDKQKITKEDIEKYDFILLPNWCIEWCDDNIFDLFINVGSLSEMDMSIIKNYIENLK